MMRRPERTEYASFYSAYIQLTKSENFLQLLDDSGARLITFFKEYPQEKENFAYAEGKWTPKQVLRHIIDTDLVFTYRALHISRGEIKNLPGFNEKSWADMAEVEHLSMNALIEEFSQLRSFIISFFRSLTKTDLEKSGTANKENIKVLSLPFIISGHTYHHLNILKERYG